MTHPAVYLVTIGVAVGVALYAFFANAPEFQRPHRTTRNSSSGCNYVKDDLGICTICIEDVTSDLIYLNCGHAFHRACIRTWLNIQKKCPNCGRIQRSSI